ncbi:proton-coupled folate transporter-like [Bradysia coprophila]|uniref:proton-coupled folate transporter-like n=1 Tax=Bradysia coprophila TaxID=38358 RepID=UPI00187DABA5|nr:proton-coupled folate transporter-like [Bradysia coprophila]
MCSARHQLQSNSNRKKSLVKQFLDFITVEPILVFLNVPLCLLSIAVQNLSLEKICRVNLKYSDMVCDNMIDKRLNNIKCSDIITTDFDSANESAALNVNNIRLGNAGPDMDLLKVFVCIAEKESQKYGSALQAYIAPFDAFVSVVVVLLAGAWSDKTGRRKPCIILPIVADCIAHIVLLVGATFMKQLPVEFTTILSTMIMSVCGGYRLMYMGIFSYLTDITTAEDRVFRLGVVYQIFPIMSVISLPLSGILYVTLGYIKLLSICIFLNICGIVYAIDYLKEVPQRREPVAFEVELMNEYSTVDGNTKSDLVREVKFSEIFNFQILRDSLNVVFRKRDYNGRTVVLLLFLMTIVYNGIFAGESANNYFFVRTKLNWEAMEEAPYAAFSCFTSFIGMVFLINICSKMLKVSDAIINVISAVTTTLSRVVFIFVSTNLVFYAATTIDMFADILTLVAKSIIAAFVETGEIGRIYSVFGMLESIAKFIFVPIYATIYKHTVSHFPTLISFAAQHVISS